MAFETAADLAHMLDADGFGATVTIDGDSVAAIFDAEYAPAGLGDLDFQGASPRLHCRTTDVEAYAAGVAVVVDGASYTLRRHEADGTGITTLILTEA